MIALFLIYTIISEFSSLPEHKQVLLTAYYDSLSAFVNSTTLSIWMDKILRDPSAWLVPPGMPVCLDNSPRGKELHAELEAESKKISQCAQALINKYPADKHLLAHLTTSMQALSAYMLVLACILEKLCTMFNRLDKATFDKIVAQSGRLLVLECMFKFLTACSLSTVFSQAKEAAEAAIEAANGLDGLADAANSASKLYSKLTVAAVNALNEAEAAAEALTKAESTAAALNEAPSADLALKYAKLLKASDDAFIAATEAGKAAKLAFNVYADAC
jgi:hypothetical protein